MAGYQPLKITGMTTGLVQSREEFILPDDAYPTLQNAYVWRERIRRKKGYQLLGRLQRTFDDIYVGSSGTSPWTFNLLVVSGYVANTNTANPGQITTTYPHGLVTGDQVTVSQIQGATGYNNATYTITVVDAVNFTVGVNAGGFGAYAEGGFWISNRSLANATTSAETNATLDPGSVTVYVNPSPLSGNILTYNNTTNCEVFTTAPHGLSTGDKINISGVVVVPGTGLNLINGGPYIISVVSTTSFTINRNSVSWATYASGGIWSEPVGTLNFQDNGDGTFTVTPTTMGVSGSVNYITGDVILTGVSTSQPIYVDYGYFPSLPVMGLRTREDQNATYFQTIAFDQKYAYEYNGSNWQEFIPGTTWNANNSDVTGTNFFWTTNYWIGDANAKIFWATNYSFNGTTGDPIRYTNGTAWADFAPPLDQTMSPQLLNGCLAMVPFRGRMVAFNTIEGTDLASSKFYTNRIRWAAIGTPFYQTDGVIVTDSTNVNSTAWISSIRGQGGFLDIPTSEDIVSVGFVRDNLVIYCQRSTWQLRYTGRSISPFQIEKVNSENGAESTFCSIQFDTSLIAIGDKGILECDSYKSELIDVKIPDFVFQFSNVNQGPQRIQGVRDFINRLAYWTIPTDSPDGIFPSQRLVYNYENDSWALFNDSLTALGTIQTSESRTWLNTDLTWLECNFAWISGSAEDPAIIGGNQQGYVEYLDAATVNDVSLAITAIAPQAITSVEITSPNHNMQTGFVINITGIPDNTPYSDLNGGVYGIVLGDSGGNDPQDVFRLNTYNEEKDSFSTPVILTDEGVYVGAGQISIRENFSIISKKFNFLDEGQNIQMGYVDILMDSTEASNPGAISMNVYVDYQEDQATNTYPQNVAKDDFFNTIIPTTAAQTLNNIGGTKFWQRVICPTRGNFLTIEYKLSNAQMAGQEQELDVQIDAQVLWIRKAGRMTQF